MRLFFTYILLLIATVASAQDLIKLSGVVTDANNEPIPGVTVVIKGSNKNTTTDLDGKFTLDAKQGSTLQFMMIGYATKEHIITQAAKLQVALNEDMLHLSEIVVTGYSSQERRDITGSVATIKPQQAQVSTTVDKLLQGQAAGVYMTNSSGALGAANQLTIRGINSIMGDNDPLYVIDGVPIYGTSRKENLTATSGGSVAQASMGGVSVSSSVANNIELNNSFEKNPLSSLNPADIESIEILKDAFSTAIYGSRGSAGVILITTRKGSRDRTKVDVNYSFSMENPVAKLNLLNGEEYNFIYSKYYPDKPFTSPYNTNWMDAVTRQAYGHNVSASVSGGTEKTNYFISAAMSSNESYIINNSLDRYSARVNLDSKLGKITTIGTNISISQVDNKSIAAPNIFAMAARKAPNLPIYTQDGKYFYGKGSNPFGFPQAYNPVAMAYENKESSIDSRITGNIYLEVRPTSWLSLKTDLGTDVYNIKTSVRKADVPLDEVTAKNQAQESLTLNTRYVINNTVNITKEWKNHFIQGVLGQSYEHSTAYANSVTGSNFFSSSLVGVGAAQKKSVSTAGETKYALFSAFARVNYQFMRKYMLGLTYRLDGSSRYAKAHRYLGTPSVSVGWRIGDEKFIKENAKWIDDLKIRASLGWSSRDANYGYYGAQAIYSLISSTSFAGSNYLSMQQPGNRNLRWEKTVTYDLGLDATLFNRKIDFTVDYYYKRTSDMLFSSNVPAYTGYTKQDQNIGDMSNQGIEFRINSHNISTKYFQWMTTLTMAANSNKILKLNFEGNQMDDLNSSYKYYAVGYPAAQFYLYNWAGVDPLTGNPLWVYADGSVSSKAPAASSKTSANNKFICGSAQPKFYGGLTNSFIYKGFELSFLFTFSYGGKMINNTKAQLLTYTSQDAYNLDKDVLKYWQMPGHETGIPKFKNESIVNNFDYTTSSNTTRFLEDNSYIRLKNLEVAYNIPEELLSRTKIFKYIRVNVSTTNLFILTRYSGLDPEVSAFGSSATASGYDNLTMPQARGFQFGIRLGF